MLPRRTLFAVPFAALALTAPLRAHATDPVLRHQEDLHGDVVVFGSTLGWDCGAGVALPAGASASCASELNTSDTSPDLYWRDNAANASITPTQARTSATLTLPSNATITYARLYWAALKVGAAPDTNATLDWLGGPQKQITADVTWVEPYGLAAHPDWYYYQASGDATDFVANWGKGDFRVSDVEALPLAGLGVDVDRAFSAWTLVVFYEAPGSDLRNLALFDGFTPIDPGLGKGSAEVTLNGFLVPPGFNARMSAFGYEGDKAYTGDHFTINGTQISDAKNPADNFFNSSRSYLGAPISGAVDIPKLSGEPGSMAGYDLDTADVTSLLQPGDTSCVVGADSSLDIFFLGGFVTSVANLAPDFRGFTKIAKDLNGGALVPGDIVEYTVTGTNEGNDAAVDVVLTDVLDPGLTLVNGSIEIVEGGAVGKKTNAGGDDEGQYDTAARKITWNLGLGADAFGGGVIDVGETFTVRFQAKVTATSGKVANQALLDASGESGAPGKTWPSDGDPGAVGAQTTEVTVYECDSDGQCSGTKPHCDPATHVCVACGSDKDCPDPTKPACEASGACGQCSAGNTALCTGQTPACDTTSGTCVLCTLGAQGDATECKSDPNGPVCVAGTGGSVHCGCLDDGDCSGQGAGHVCDSVSGVCVEGCRGTGGNGCPGSQVCDSTDTTLGGCKVDTGNGGAGGSIGGEGGGVIAPGDPARCGCEVPGKDQGSTAPMSLAALLGLALLARRRRS
jgi:uncharacterized repeat protein (TIGR01451 family)/MYXO-CTERM domain-containing protein